MYLYHNFSDNKTYNLIHLISIIANCTKKDSFIFLCNIFFTGNCIQSISAPAPIDKFIQDNLDCLNTLSKQYRFLKKTIPCYKELHLMLKARVQVTNVPYLDYKLQAGAEYIAKQINAKRKIISKYLTILSYVGIITKVESYNHTAGKKSVNTYKIPSLPLRLTAVTRQLDNLQNHYSNVFKTTQDDLDKIIMW